ncbi:MAG: DUF5696 domain-containing protein [Oscillospiraceae bacterium]|jgi:hypothetical protein|nr:DUF5696 domain-containing protein [Oscillospiraceae bacterium]
MKRIFSLLLIVLLLGLTACSTTPALREEVYDSITEVATPKTRDDLHAAPSTGKLKKVAASGIVELYFDPVTYTVSVKETVSGQYWHALPPTIKGQTDDAAPISLTVRDGAQRYFWNVQENSVAFGKAKADNLPDGTGIVVSYDCFPNVQEAANPMSTRALRVTLRYTLVDGSLVVRAGYQALAQDTSVVLEEMGVLETFGAYAKSEKDDFLLLPDGAGATALTAKGDTNFTQPLRFQIYGADPAASAPKAAYAAILPVFGIRHGKSGFAAYIEQGDAIAQVVADRVRTGNAINSVGARFAITPTTSQEKNGDVRVFTASDSYREEVSICYRFLSGEKANTAGMAGALREQMQRSKLIPTEAVVNQEKLPVNVTLTALAKIKKAFEYRKMLTTTQQAQELLLLLKSKGIDNINLQYLGAVGQSAGVRVRARAGNNAGYAALQKTAQAQNMRLFLDVPFLSGYSSAAAQSLFGKPVKIPQTGEVSALYNTKTDELPLRAIGSLKKRTEKIALSLRDIQPMGLSLSDLDVALSSDYTGDARYNRQQASGEIKTRLGKLATGRALMVPGGNFYLLSEASVVTHLPAGPSAGTESAAYASVPLAPMLLHGVVDYSFTPLNFEADMETALLKSIALGALPAFSWVAETPEGSEKANLLDYDNTLSFAATAAEKGTKALADLRGARITGFTTHQTGVTSTEYENGAVVYVNATNKAVKVNSLNVAPMSFLRVNG